MGDMIFFAENSKYNSTVWFCRICHEEELEDCMSLEAPCACSGTLKLAHRDGVTRRKGNATCEIRLQQYEPGYTATSKTTHRLGEAEITISENELLNRRLQVIAEGRLIQRDHSQCTTAADRSKCRCRWLALTVRHSLLKQSYSVSAV